MDKIVFIAGTRPEVIKMAPVISEMVRRRLRKNMVVVHSGQHRELTKRILMLSGVRPDFTLDLIVPGQTLNDLSGRALVLMQQLVDTLRNKNKNPVLIVAQGDTVTAFAAAITAFHNRIPFAHIEAGLRTNNVDHPYPEEFYRRSITMTASAHFAPTSRAVESLKKENVPESKIFLTGNTVVDSLELFKSHLSRVSEKKAPAILPSGEKDLVLITCHRRENIGDPMLNVIEAVKKLANKHRNLQFIWVSHCNPSVLKTISDSGLASYPRVRIVPPLDYFDLLSLYPRIRVLITDSGGIQEEAPSFKVPAIVIRETTERPESIEQGFAFLCGSDPEKIRVCFDSILKNTPEISHNPFGDGKASSRISDYLQSQIRKTATVPMENLIPYERVAG
jgi:UDP-N-acetylglucosamine 2-epimerase (non-hydrolysing)